jgi:hypothetical protein
MGYNDHPRLKPTSLPIESGQALLRRGKRFWDVISYPPDKESGQALLTPGATNITSHPGPGKRNGKLNAKCEAHQQGEPYKLFHHNHFFD